MPVSPVSGQHPVCLPQRIDGADDRSFLALAKLSQPRDSAGLLQSKQRILKHADTMHPEVKFEKHRWREFRLSVKGWRLRPLAHEFACRGGCTNSSVKPSGSDRKST